METHLVANNFAKPLERKKWVFKIRINTLVIQGFEGCDPRSPRGERDDRWEQWGWQVEQCSHDSS